MTYRSPWLEGGLSSFDDQIGMAKLHLVLLVYASIPTWWFEILKGRIGEDKSGPLHGNLVLRASIELTTRVRAYIHAESRVPVQTKRGTTYVG